MRKILNGFFFLFIFFILGSLNAIPARAIDGFVTITSPNGGTLTEGDTMHITWTSSANIDQINIGYKGCPSCLDWVVFTMPNTGSYDWKVDVGNTTNTQFYLQITGYETGKGSVTSNSGMFTVYQKDSSPSFPSSSPMSYSPRPSSGGNNLVYPSPSAWIYRAGNTPAPTQKPISPLLSIYSLQLWSEFTWEGSRTTKLNEITNAKSVEHFTLDTREGYTFIFQEPLNLTDQKNLAALASADKYWEFKPYFVWIEWEWWLKYDVTETIEVEYKNDNLTSYLPNIAKDPQPTASPKLTVSQASKHKEPQVIAATTGRLRIAINDGTPVKILPNVTLDGDKVMTTHYPTLTVKGHTSHTDLTFEAEVNGEDKTVHPEIDRDSGEMKITVNGLIRGANNVKFYYRQDGGDRIEFGEKTIMYKPNWWDLNRNYVYIGSAIILAFLMGSLQSKIRIK